MEITVELRYCYGCELANDGIAILELDTINNHLATTVTHLSEFAMFGRANKIFLPLVTRGS